MDENNNKNLNESLEEFRQKIDEITLAVDKFKLETERYHKRRRQIIRVLIDIIIGLGVGIAIVLICLL